jgi:transposase
MNNNTSKQEIKILGIDLAKNSFHVFGINNQGVKVLTKKMTRHQLARFCAKLSPCLIAMEACGSAHYWARKFQSYGHEVKLMAPQFVKPFVKSNKNDSLDAEAICEAVQRPNMRFVAIKTEEQLASQSLHRIRSQLVKSRTAQINQIRGLLLEHGITIPKSKANIHKALIQLLDEANTESPLSDMMKILINDLKTHLDHLEQRIADYDHQIKVQANDNQWTILLQTIPGIGPVIATAMMSHIGDITLFKNGRELAAFLGLVPRQYSTGGKNTLLGISKRGDVYLRTLLIHGARSVLQNIKDKTDATSCWLKVLVARRGKNIATVALANKMARTAYALLSTGEIYNENHGLA